MAIANRPYLSGFFVMSKVGQLLCQQDSYLKNNTCTVISCVHEGDLYAVLLSDTVIFPTGGGQPFDQGTINGIPVVECQRRGLDCIHLIKEPLETGTIVQVELDWQRRFDHMQQVISVN